MSSVATSHVHVPVMRDRVIALLAPALEQPGAVLVDATLGLGGHAEAALAAFPGMRLVGLDRDTDALELSRTRLSPFARRTTLVHAVYDEIGEVLASLGIPSVQGVLFDLGVSSMQLDSAERGFAYAQDAPLDMRMDQTADLTAAEVVNTYPAPQLARILREYGEERFASKIAANIVKARPVSSTSELADIVRASIPAPARRTGGNPAKRTFQALRIEVNGELDALRRAIPAALDALAVGGRIVVMSYQSLEDRIVKQALAEGATSHAPADLPVVPASMEPWLKLVTRGAETPDDAELAANPRSASVRVRAAERVAA